MKINLTLEELREMDKLFDSLEESQWSEIVFNVSGKILDAILLLTYDKCDFEADVDDGEDYEYAWDRLQEAKRLREEEGER